MKEYFIGKIYKGEINGVDILILGETLDSVVYFEFKNWRKGYAPKTRMAHSTFLPSESKYFFAVTSTFDNGNTQWHHQSHSYSEAAKIYNNIIKYVGKNEVIEIRVAKTSEGLDDNYGVIYSHEFGKDIKWA